MNELIKISNMIVGGAQIQTVNARELHAFLQAKTRFNDWIAARVHDYGFAQGVDFVSFTESSVKPEGGRPAVDYALSLGMAKELAMVERNEQGKKARLYFIECERRVMQTPPSPQADLNDPETLQYLLLAQLEERKRLTAMLHESQSHIEKLVDRVVDAEACAESFRLLAGISGTFCLTDAAKNLDVSPRQWLIPWMQANKWIFKRQNSKTWIPYQYRLETGDLAFKMVLDETGAMREQCRVTPKGMAKIAKVVVEMYKAETGAKLLVFKRKPAVKKS